MRIASVEISNFRALRKIAVPMRQFSVLLGENDVGKTSFLYAIENFFSAKKLNDPKDWYKHDTSADIRVTVTFSDISDDESLGSLIRNDGTIIVNRIFSFNKTPITKAILDDNSAIDIEKPTAARWFSSNNFHFIPVRRDLAVQFSMNKTAMLGKLLRATMRQAIEDAGAETPLQEVANVLKGAIDGPRLKMEEFLKEQLSNDSVKLGFDDLEIDPTEGVKFSVTLSDDRVDSIDIQDRGAGTQNNLIIALFRLLATSNLEGDFIFAMEEPENSLHPKAQRQLLGVVQDISKSTQVIVTTHSPVFIDRSQFESNILLTRTKAGNTVAKVFDPVDLASIRTDLGIRASDALLKGGGNCAILVEGNTEEDGFPIFMEMMGLSEFELGIAIINMGGSDFIKAQGIIKLLGGYDIPCVIVLDRDAQVTADDLTRVKGMQLSNLKEVYCLANGTIEDYYPTSVVAEVINRYLSPTNDVLPEELDGEWSGKERLDVYKRIMHEHEAGSSIEYLKSALGGYGTKILQEQGSKVHVEIQVILNRVAEIAAEN